MVTGKSLYKSIYWKILQMVLSFSINLFLTRQFQSSVSAEFYSFVYLLSLCASFFTLGLDIGLNYYLSCRQITPATACRIIFAITGLSLLICIPLMAFLFRPSGYPDLSLGKWLFFSACHISGVLLTNLSATIFTAFGKNYVVAKYSFRINLLLAVLVLFISIFLNGQRLLESLFFLYFAFSFLQGAVLFILAVLRYVDIRAGAPALPAGIRSIVVFSFAAFITNFISFLAGRFCIYLLPNRVAGADLGNYIQAYKLVEYLSLIAAILYYPFIALVAGQPKEITREMTNEKLLLLLVRLSNTGVLIFSLCMFACGNVLLPFIYGPSFGGMYGIFLCLVAGLFPACSSTFFTAYYYGAGRLKYNFVSASIQLAAVFILFFPLTAAWGVRGAAFAFSISALASMTYDCIVFRRMMPFTLQDMLITKKQDWEVVRTFVGKLLKPAEK